MFYTYIRRGFVLGMFLIMVIFCSQNMLMAKDIVSNRTGDIKITKPDGVVLTIGKDEPLPDIPSGSTVEVLSGGMEIGPTEGFIQVVVGDSVATVKAGDRVTAGIDAQTKMADFNVDTGQINIITGNTTTTVRTNQEVMVGLDKRAGVVELKSIKGTVEAITVGVKASVPQGAAAKISADAKTRNIHIEAVKGKIIVISIDGELNEVAEGKSIDTPGSAVGEIQTFAEEVISLPTEEPAEIEVPEATPHRP